MKLAALLLVVTLVVAAPAADLRIGLQSDSPFLGEGGDPALERALGPGFRITASEGTTIRLVTLARRADAERAERAVRKAAIASVRFVERDFALVSDTPIPDGFDTVEDATCFFCHSRNHGRRQMRAASVIAKVRQMSRDRFRELFITVDSAVMRRLGRDFTAAQREAIRLYVQRLPEALPARLPAEEQP